MSTPYLTPADLAQTIAAGQIAAEQIPTTAETPTVPAAAQALGIRPEQIIKSLLFLVCGRPVLVIATGCALVDRRVLADHFGVGKKQIKLADAETVRQVTGYPVGGVPPFGYPAPVPVLLDRAALAWDVVYGGGGDDRTMLRLTPAELARVVQPQWIDLGLAEGADGSGVAG